MDTSFLRSKLPLLAAVLAVVALAVSPVRAAAQTDVEKEFVGFTTTNVQLLYGWAFNDNLLGYNPPSRAMMTLTFNNFTEWKYGDSFFFADLQSGNDLNGSGQNAAIYAEWHPRVFVNRIIGQTSPALGFIRNYGLAFEVNQGQGFQAYLVGAGMDFELPGYMNVGMNFYWRYSALTGGFTEYQNTWQFSPFWTIPFKTGPVPWVFTGFVDIFVNPNGHIDLMAQPQLLVDVLGLAGGKGNRLYVGCEWYIHSYQNIYPNDPVQKTVSAPQLMVQWTIH
jgi:nucleoside-specific outer membrane channel protein Tsx